MANFDNSADMGKQSVIKFIKERMKDKGLNQFRLAELSGVPDATLSRNFAGTTEMSVTTLLKICGVLELRPYFIPAELDKNEINKIYFN